MNLLLAALMWTSALAQQTIDPFFLSAGLVGYTIVPLQSEEDNPNGVAFRMELHRSISFEARAAKHHAVGLAFDFVGIDVAKKWRRLMATYSFKRMLVRLQTGQISGRFGNGRAFTGPYTDVIIVHYGDFFAAVGARYTRVVRPVTTFTYTDSGGKNYGLDEGAYIETVGPVFFSDRMFEAMRDGSLNGPGIYPIDDSTAFAIDVIGQVGVSRLLHSLAYQRNVQASPSSFLTFHATTELRGSVMSLPSRKPIGGSGGLFIKNTIVGAGSDSSENLRPVLTPEFHMGPYVRIGGLF